MPFQPGDAALLVDEKGRRFLLRLMPGQEFNYHRGSISHDELIAAGDGATVISSGGAEMLLLSPRVADYVLKMKRGAQVVYPKDLGPILVYADIWPGMSVFEAGTGSGALTIGLARAVGPAGSVVSVERREDHAAHARKSIERWAGSVPDHLELVVGDATEELGRRRADRVVLDLPEPWELMGPAAGSLGGGGILCAYLPTVPQVQSAVETARSSGHFGEIEVLEVLHREWNVDGRSVRPAHRMVGHTGFLVFMRRVGSQERSGAPGN